MPGPKYNEGDIIITKSGGRAKILWTGRVKNLANKNKVYGIEFIDETFGCGDGTFHAKRYFIGRKNKCSFVKYSEIRKKCPLYKYFAIGKTTKAPCVFCDHPLPAPCVFVSFI
eukprot:185924_1